MAEPWPCVVAREVGTLLRVTVVPQARRTGADGLHDGMLRVRLLAPPVDGKANEALLAWLSEGLRLPRRSLQLCRGQTSRRKEILIDLPAESVTRWLESIDARCQAHRAPPP